MSAIVPTVRPYQKPAVVSLTSSHVVVIDHPTLGMMSMSYADLRTQLDATYAAAQAACAASQSAATTSQVAAAASASTATTQASASGVSASAAGTSQVAAAASATAAGLSQTAAGVSATAAGASQTAAGISATAALASQTAAAASEVSTTASAATALANANTAIAQASAAAGSASAANASQIATGVSAAAAAGSANAADLSVLICDARATTCGTYLTATTTARNDAASSATTATSSAAAAAASAANALAAISQAFKGGLAGASVPATSTATGDTYRITSVGTSQGKTWAIGDAAIYNGTSGSWTQLTGFYAYADNADLSATAALIEREGLRFDGTAKVPVVLPAPGTGDFTLIAAVSFADTTSQFGIFGANSGGGGLSFYRSDSGTLILESNGVVYIARSIALTWEANRIYVLVAQRSSGAIYFYRDGTLITNASNDNPTYNISVGCSYIGSLSQSTGILNGTISRAAYPNYALTAAEIAALTRRGLVTLPEQRGGSMVALNTGAFTNNSLDTFTGVSATGFTAASASSTANKYSSSNSFSVKTGQKFLLTYTYSHTSGSFPAGNLYDFTGLFSSGTIIPVNGFNSQVINSTGNGTNTKLILGWNFTTGSGVFSNLSIIPLGTLFEQDSGQRNAGYMVRDTSGNNADLILPASGVSVIDPAMRGIIRFTTNTSGNQQIGGSQVIIPTNARISSWVINSSGTPNVTLGNVAAGAQYRASAAVVTGDNQIALLTPFTPTGNLWVNSSTTATLKHTIMWEYIQ